jgi:hypothetical protein
LVEDTALSDVRSHLFIPDTQDRPGVPKQHLAWLGEYIAHRKPDVVVHAGDHWDMPSLNSHHDKGSKQLECQRYVEDVQSGNESLELLRAPARRARLRTEFHLTLGNHENRISRTIEADPRLDGQISLDDLQAPGWTVHPYLVPVWIDGVCYSHFFYQPMSGRPFSGTVDNRLKQIGHSFTMGHQQTLLYGVRFVAGKSQHGLVAGSYYLHQEDYKGPQGNAHWRGVVVKHEVSEGAYCPMFVSMDFLCRRYEGMSLERFKKLNKIK